MIKRQGSAHILRFWTRTPGPLADSPVLGRVLGTSFNGEERLCYLFSGLLWAMESACLGFHQAKRHPGSARGISSDSNVSHTTHFVKPCCWTLGLSRPSSFGQNAKNVVVDLTTLGRECGREKHIQLPRSTERFLLASETNVDRLFLDGEDYQGH